MTSKFVFASWFAVVLTAGVVVQNAFAQPFGRVADRPFSGRVHVVFPRLSPVATGPGRMPGDRLGQPGVQRVVTKVDIGTAIRSKWRAVRQQVTNELSAAFRERDLGGGFRLYDINLTLAEDGQLFVGWDGRGFILKYVLQQNHVRASVRIPGPSPSGTDPRFSDTFDAEATVDVDIVGAKLILRPIQLKLFPQQPHGVNFTGRAFLTVVDFFGGSDLIGQARRIVNNREIGLTRSIQIELAKLNPALATATRDTVIKPDFDSTHNELTLTL